MMYCGKSSSFEPRLPPEVLLASLFFLATGHRVPAEVLKTFMQGPHWKIAASLAHHIHRSKT